MIYLFIFIVAIIEIITWVLVIARSINPENPLLSGSVRSRRTTVSSPSEQVSDLYSVSFKRSDSVRALTYNRLSTELINFTNGGSYDEVSQ